MWRGASRHRPFRLRAGDPIPDSVRGDKMMAQPWLKSITDQVEKEGLTYSLEFCWSDEWQEAVLRDRNQAPIVEQPDVEAIAADYQRGGAAAISVVTEPRHFSI